MALRDVGANFESWKTCEWDINAIKQYKAIHCSDNMVDYSHDKTKEELVEILFKKGISNDGKNPMSKNRIQNKNEKWLREIYNNCCAISNLVDISRVSGKELQINNKEKYCYILTYSFPCTNLSIAGLQNGMKKEDNTASSLLWEVKRILSECTTGSKTIFSYNFTQEALKLYLDSIDYITQKLYRDNFVNALTLSLMTFCNYMYNVSIYALSKKYITDGSLDSDEMTTVQKIVDEGFNNISGNMKSIFRIRKALGALRSIYSILDTPSLISPFEKDNLNKISANNIKGKIEFRNVYFAYPFQPEHVILKNISFTILPGQKVALIGNSGCGKSSIIQLINRYYDVEDGKGEILIDDINIKDYNLYDLKKKIGFVQQEPSLFKRSNIENVRYGNLEATTEECYEAAKKVNALNILERDNDVNLKEKGLPAGDKQKLAISRIFLKNPPILLLDEPTSALDKESEMEIEKSLDILSENKTTITIAHRLNTIVNYDKIIVFDDGRIKEQGTHDELIKLRKRYYTFHKFSNLG